MNKKTIIAIVASLLVVVVGFILYTAVVEDDTPKTCATYGGRVERQCIEDYVGLSQEEAINRAKHYGYVPKIVSIDGAGQGVTDEGSTPIYLEIQNGKVTGGYFEAGRRTGL